jgi:hypothetical protein
MNTNAKFQAQISKKLLTKTEEDTLARYIAQESFNKFKMSADALQLAFDCSSSWSPAVVCLDAPIRQTAKLTTAASDRIKRNALKYVREWQNRREQGAN